MSQDSCVASDPCVQKLKVLADPTRLEVVRRLLDGPSLVGELNDGLDVEQSLLSHHLRVLREAGLVVAERDGKAMRYSLADGVQVGGQALDLGCCSLSFEQSPAPEKPGP